MKESKMKQVAQLLGVELGEEFKIKDDNRTFRFTNDGLFDCHSYECKCRLLNLLKGKYEIEKPVLDKVEKRYLENVLRPFKDRVVYVKKKNSISKQYLYFCLNSHDYFSLPLFEKDTMYKGMELNKEYTLKELGLFEK